MFTLHSYWLQMNYSQAFLKKQKHWWLIITQLQIKNKDNKQTKKKHQRDTCWHDKVSHHAICKLILFTGWASLVSTELCRRACMHVCHLTCALFVLEQKLVCACVCRCRQSVCVCGMCRCVRTYVKQATNEPHTGWSVALFLFCFFCCFFSYDLSCQV